LLSAGINFGETDPVLPFGRIEDGQGVAVLNANDLPLKRVPSGGETQREDEKNDLGWFHVLNGKNGLPLSVVLQKRV